MTIRPRRVRFDWQATPLHYVPGDPQTTHTINVLHLMLPGGERWFVDVYRQALPLITDETLREAVRGFMGQEATHSVAHAAFVEHLRAQGVDAAPFLARLDRLFARTLGDAPRGRTLSAAGRRRWLRIRLALIAAIEHMTCVLGAWILDARGLEQAGIDRTMLDLLRWHGAEEVEHRSVAFDVHEHLGGGWPLRAATMLIAFGVMTWLWSDGTVQLMAADPTRPGKPTWGAYLRAARRGRVPSPRQLWSAPLRYLRRDHHPEHEASTEQALAWLARS